MDHGWFFRSSVGRRLHGPVSQRLAVMNKAAANFRSRVSARSHVSQLNAWGRNGWVVRNVSVNLHKGPQNRTGCIGDTHNQS